MNKKRGLEFSFAWIFAILVGMVVLFLAVYGVVRLVDTERRVTDSEAAKELGILLNPIEAGTGSAKVSRIVLQKESKIYNECNNEGDFGSQGIGIATSSGIGNKWEKPGVISRFRNKYLFSSGIVQGDEFITFSKSFKMPYEIADVIFLWSADDNYCLIDPPLEVREELESLSPEGINVTDSVGDCLIDSKKVCFKSTGCDIDVSHSSKSVKKNWTTVYYEGALIYGAIFSDIETYECQVERLMKRGGQIAELYAAKSQYVSSVGCNSNLNQELLTYSNSLEINNSEGLRKVRFLADNLEDKNDDLSCKIF